MNIDELRAEVERVKAASKKLCDHLDDVIAQSNRILERLEHTKVSTRILPDAANYQLIKPEGK